MTRLSPSRIFAGYLAGMLLVQMAWILTVPAFRGSDEFDHVYKAAAVSRGQWTAPNPAPDGRGGIVTIPGDIVRAASSVCRSYEYTGHDNCFPIKSVGGGDVEVATAAGAYNPSYYLIVGTLTRPFSGVAADFAMRAVSALICALLVAWAAAITVRWACTTWPFLTLAVGLTPVLVYSTSMAAPNGVTFAAAALVWSSLTGLAHAKADGRGLAAPLTIGSVALVATHSSGAMWLTFILLIALALKPFRAWVVLLLPRWKTWLLSAAVVLIATLLCLIWIRLVHTISFAGPPLEDDGSPFPYERLPVIHLVWTLQAIAAFPLRDEPAPVPVYVIWGIPLLAVLVALFRSASGRERLASAMTLVILAVVPTVLSVLSFESQGLAWQGRYSLPLWLGITSLAGLALDRRAAGPDRRTERVLFLFLATAMTISTVNVGLREVAQGPTDPIVAAFPGGFVVVGALTALGTLVWLALLEWARAKAQVPVGSSPRTKVTV